MPSVFSLHTDPSLNTSDPDGICSQRRSTAKKCGSDSRVGPTSQVRSGPPKGWIRLGRGTRLPDERLSFNNLTYMDPPALSRALERHNTFRDRCRHISDLSVKVLSPFGP